MIDTSKLGFEMVKRHRPEKKSNAYYYEKTKKMQSYNRDTLAEQFNALNASDFIDTIIDLGSEGKNVINILNQRLLAKKLDGKFVGDIEDSWDIEANGKKIELKSQVTVAPGTYAGKIGFGDWSQKSGWDLLVHHLPEKFNTFIDEDKFLVFDWSDRDRLLEYNTAKGRIYWTASLYNHNGDFRKNADKVKWMMTKIVNLEGLKNKIYECN